MQVVFFKIIVLFSLLTLACPLWGQNAPPCFTVDTTLINSHLEKGEACWQEQRIDSMDWHFAEVLRVYQAELPWEGAPVDSFCQAVIWEHLSSSVRYFSHHGHRNYELATSKLASTFFEQIQSPRFLAIAYQELGKAYGMLRLNDQALHYSFLALSIEEKTGMNLNLNETLNTIAVIYSAMGDQESSLVYLEKAMKEFTEEKGYESLEVLRTLNNIGFAYQTLGELKEAMAYYGQAERLSVKLKGAESLYAANVYNNIAAVLHEQGHFEQALPYLQRGLTSWETKYGSLHPYTCTFHLELGRNYTLLGRDEEALMHLRTALKGRSASLGKQHFMTGYAYFGLAEYYAHNDQTEQALLYIDSTYQAISFDRKTISSLSEVSYFPLLLKAVRKEIQLWDKQGDSEHALRRICQPCQNLVSTIEYLHYNVYNAKASRRIRAELKPVLNSCMSASTALFDLSGVEEAFELALAISEWNKAVSLFSGLKDHANKQAYQVPEDWIIEEWEVKRQLKLLDREIQSTEEDVNISELRDRQFAQQEALRKLMLRYKAEYPDYYSNRFLSTNPLPVQQFKEELFTSEEHEKTLLEYYVGDKTIYVFLLQKDRYELYTLPLDFALDESIRLLEEGLSAYFLSSSEENNTPLDFRQLTAQYARQAQLLYEKLVAPISDQLTHDLIIIPDEKLHFVPFELLLSKAPEELRDFSSYSYWLREKTIGYAFNLQVLREQVAKKIQYFPEKQLLAMAPFAVSTTESLLKSANPRLIGSREEVNEIAKIWNGDTIIGSLATKQAFCENAPNYAMLHLATHAESDTLFGEKSYISFAPSLAPSPSNKLYMNELLVLKINCELVILSACETAQGEFLRGEGVISISRAFTLAGAKSTVTALWPTEDQATKNIMIDFHRALATDISKDYALRQAKLNYLDATPGFQSHPFFWGGIIFIGDRRAINQP